MGVRDVFPADNDDKNDPLSLKKLQKLEAICALHKTFLVLPLKVLKKLFGSKRQNVMLYPLSCRGGSGE